MKTLAIIGSGDLGQLIAYHALADGHTNKVIFFDDFRKPGDKVLDCNVEGGIKDIEKILNNKNTEAIIAIGYKHFELREKLFNHLEKLIPFATIIHSSSFVDKSCKIGKGVFILPGCTLDKGVTIGNNVLLNTSCIVAHDSKIESHSFLAPGVCLAGFISIGQKCMLGIHTTVIDNIKICDNTITGGGTVVINDIVEPGLYVGCPAKKIK